MSVDTLLSRLDKVRKTGAGRWIARCPAHDDKSPSLAVRELDEGRVLLHCFASCEAAEVLAAIGLEFQDLFPERLTDQHLPKERRSFNAHDILKCIGFEVLIVHQCSTILLRNAALNSIDHARLVIAANRIQAAERMANHGA